MAELSKKAFNALRQIKFSNSTHINGFFIGLSKGHDFIDWFNRSVFDRNSKAFPNPMPDSITSKQNFVEFWDALPEVFQKEKISIFDFAALACIVYNETGGRYRSLTEMSGSRGLAYTFNKISGLKLSYNTLPGNFTAFKCFTDPDFCAVHKDLPLAEKLSGAVDPAKISPLWKGETYPAAFSTEENPLKTGFIMEADFYKFRGRGVIQTTGRSNYKNLVAAIQQYKGENPVIRKYQQKWKDWSSDKVCTCSRNADWDDFFQDRQAMRLAVAVFNRPDVKGNHPFSMSDLLETLNLDASTAGSIFFMGKKVSGAAGYAKNKFKPRVVQLLEAIAGEI